MSAFLIVLLFKTRVCDRDKTIPGLRMKIDFQELVR